LQQQPNTTDKADKHSVSQQEIALIWTHLVTGVVIRCTCDWYE